MSREQAYLMWAWVFVCLFVCVGVGVSGPPWAFCMCVYVCLSVCLFSLVECFRWHMG